MKKNYSLSILLIISILFCNCSKDDESTIPEIVKPINFNLSKSLVQKGPFIQGSTITIQELNDNLSSSKKTFTTETNDDFGSFDINTTLESTKIDISATGFYFNEVSGELSNAQLTLRTYVEFDNENRININILTTLARLRTKYLIITEGLTYIEAKKQSESELLNAFNIPELVQERISNFENLDISQEGEGNAVLLAISTILQGDNSVAELSEFMAKLAEDLETDGIINDAANLEEIKTNNTIIDSDGVKQNLKKRFDAIGVTYTIPNFEKFIDSDGDGIVNIVDIELSAPIGETTDTKPDFAWTKVGKENITYGIQVSDSENFETLLIDESGLQTTSFSSPIALENNISYFWRVNYTDANGITSDWTSAQFNIDLKLDIQLTAPIDETTDTKPNFSWTETKQTDVKYGIQVSDSENFETLLIDESGLQTTSFSSPIALENNTSYFWRVNYTDVNGITSNWTTAQFNINLGSVILVSPSQTEGVLKSPEFSWEESEIPNATYEIEVALDENFSEILFSQSNILETQLATSNLLTENNTSFYWRVRATDGNDVNSEWSEIFVFIFELEIPVINNNNSSNPEIIEIIYDQMNNPSFSELKLEIEISSDIEFSTISKRIENLSPELGKTYVIWDQTIDDGVGNFYYRSRYRTTEGIFGQWDEAKSFTIFDTADAEVILLDPDTTTLKPIIKWSHSGLIPSNYNYKVTTAIDAEFSSILEESDLIPVVEDTATQFPEYQINTELTSGLTYYYKVEILDTTQITITNETSFFTVN